MTLLANPSRAFAILRVAKLKSFGNLASSLQHTFRTRPTPNADPARRGQNSHETSSDEAAMDRIRDRLPAKRRSDAVLALEYFVGASPGWFEAASRQEQDAYFEDAVRWLQTLHGVDNVVSWSVHRDETSPHLVAYVVPLDDRGVLNAKRFVGGRQRLSAMQTAFAEQVGRPHGLERGIQGSRAKHTTVRDWYAAIQKPLVPIKVSKMDLSPKIVAKGSFFRRQRTETPQQVQDRINAKLVPAQQVTHATAAKVKTQASELVSLQRTARSLETEVQRHRQSLDAAELRHAEREERLQAELLKLRTNCHQAEDLLSLFSDAEIQRRWAGRHAQQQAEEERQRGQEAADARRRSLDEHQDDESPDDGLSLGR